MIRYANSGVGRSTNIQRLSFAVRMPRTLFTPFVGRVRMGLRSPYAVGDMILRDEPSVTMAS